jgi:hypothetical protein
MATENRGRRRNGPARGVTRTLAGEAPRGIINSLVDDGISVDNVEAA